MGGARGGGGGPSASGGRASAITVRGNAPCAASAPRYDAPTSWEGIAPGASYRAATETTCSSMWSAKVSLASTVACVAMPAVKPAAGRTARTRRVSRCSPRCTTPWTTFAAVSPAKPAKASMASRRRRTSGRRMAGRYSNSPESATSPLPPARRPRRRSIMDRSVHGTGGRPRRTVAVGRKDPQSEATATAS